jgi:L-fucose mutarotase
VFEKIESLLKETECMLKGISPLISPPLLKVLDEMGHGDEIVLGDANFPALTCAQGSGGAIRADGHAIPALLEAVLRLFPLDYAVENPIALMDNGDPLNRPPVWNEYAKIIRSHEGDRGIELVPRFDFYERAKKAYAIVATGEYAKYGNILLKKGVLALDA